ncbi:MAG: hypothetical protein KAX65_07375 [Caldilineaceae bacterium]|nr:hypothetical protein [Caldilineaceae bacterium]
MNSRYRKSQQQHDERMARLCAQIDAANAAKSVPTYEQLRAQLAAATARAEAAEAKLAIVEAYAEYYYYARRDHEYGGPTPWPFFDEWLERQSEVQP